MSADRGWVALGSAEPSDDQLVMLASMVRKAEQLAAGSVDTLGFDDDGHLTGAASVVHVDADLWIGVLVLRTDEGGWEFVWSATGIADE